MQQLPAQSDVVVVGAGPHGLSMALRWVQGSVGNFSDHEHILQTNLNTKSGHTNVNQPSNTHTPTPNRKKAMRITVIDPAGSWLAKWNSLFDALEIRHLRSTMFMHPDTFDVYSFLAYAYANNRQSELVPITELYCEHQLPGSEIKRKKKERAQFKGFSPFPENRRELFFRPSQNLFKDYCLDLIGKYNLEDRVFKGSVASTELMPNGKYCLTLDSGNKIEAKYVVFSTGFSQPLFPTWYKQIKESAPEKVMGTGEWCAKKPHLSDDINDKKILIVGGGLTSAHLALAAIKRGCKKVVLVSRKYLVTKLFDLGLEWMGVCRNLQYSKFWNLSDFQKRLEMIKGARGGGSITYDVRRQMVAAETAGNLQIIENCEVTNIQAEGDGVKVNLTGRDESEEFDYVWVATGSKIDISSEPYLQSYLKSNSIESKAGFPILDQDLKLHPKHNIFVMGPDARNLSGCRNAADRICAFIEDSEAEHAANAKKAVSQKKIKNPKQEKDLSWNNFGNEHFNAYSILAEACGE